MHPRYIYLAWPFDGPLQISKLVIGDLHNDSRRRREWHGRHNVDVPAADGRTTSPTKEVSTFAGNAHALNIDEHKLDVPGAHNAYIYGSVISGQNGQDALVGGLARATRHDLNKMLCGMCGAWAPMIWSLR